MTALLTALLIFIILAYWLNRIVKRVVVKPVAKNGVTGQEILIEKTRWQVWREWLRPMAWGVVVGR